MEITLSPTLKQFAEDRVASGEYASISDVVNDALARLRDGHDSGGWTDE